MIQLIQAQPIMTTNNISSVVDVGEPKTRHTGLQVGPPYLCMAPWCSHLSQNWQ